MDVYKISEFDIFLWGVVNILFKFFEDLTIFSNKIQRYLDLEKCDQYMVDKGLITEFYVYYKIIVARKGCLSTRHMLNWENKESINIGGTGMEAMNSFVTMGSFFSA